MNNIALFLRAIGEHGMAEEVESEHNRLEAFADGLDKDCLNAQFKAGAASRDEEIESMRQQLDAALAAIKIKDEALGRIRGHLNLYNLFSCVGSDSYDPECADLNAGKCREIAIEALAIQPDDSALKAYEQTAWEPK